MLMFILSFNTLFASLCFSYLGFYIFPHFTELRTVAESFNTDSAAWIQWSLIAAGAGTPTHILFCILAECCSLPFAGYFILFTAIVDAIAYAGVIYYKVVPQLCSGVANSWSAVNCENAAIKGVGIGLFVVSALLQLFYGISHSFPSLVGGGSSNSLAHSQPSRPRRFWHRKADAKAVDEEHLLEAARKEQRAQDSEEEDRRASMSRR